jgi:iron complex outermembrane receptor protein
VTLEGDFIRNDQTFDRGVVAVGNRLGAIPRSRFLGEPGDGRIRNENATLQLRMEHKLNNDWTLRLGGQYLGGTLEGYSTEASRLLADGRTLQRERRFRDYAWDDLSCRPAWSAASPPARCSTPCCSAWSTRTTATAKSYFAPTPTRHPSPIDVYNPVYGRTPPPLTRRTDTLEQTRTYAAFVQDQVTITPRLKAVAGLRVEQFEQDFAQRTTGVATPPVADRGYPARRIDLRRD